MFTAKEYLDGGYKDEIIEERVSNETFLIRRLDGIQRQEYAELKTAKERILYALANCLLDGTTRKEIGRKAAEDFLRNYDALGNHIANCIFKYTIDCLNTERELWGLAEKNLQEISSSGSTGNTADATD